MMLSYLLRDLTRWVCITKQSLRIAFINVTPVLLFCLLSSIEIAQMKSANNRIWTVDLRSMNLAECATAHDDKINCFLVQKVPGV